jgi:hypothetical protein
MTIPGQPKPTAPTSGPPTSGPAISATTTGALAPTAPRAATPGTPPPPTPAKPAKSGGSAAAGAYLLAVVALVMAVAAGAAAAYAVKTAWEVRDANNAAAPETSTATTTATPTATASASTSPSATSSPTPSRTTTPGPTYSADFTRAQVNVPAPAASSCNSAYVDVDTLAFGDAAAAGHEFYFTTCGSPLRVFVDRTSGRAISTTADPTPAACHDRVTGTPTSELQMPATEGLTFCLLTNKAQATAQSLPQRLAIVNIESISATQIRLVVSTYQFG